MFEKALHGSGSYWAWMATLAAVACLGGWCYADQLRTGLGITGLSRDVTWGLYIAQFTFLVGVAASAVVVVLPYYLHDHKVFGTLAILGEFVAVSAVVMSGLFIVVDMGQPARVLNVLRFPTPWSMMFWDMVALGGYLVLNVVITRVALDAERNGAGPPRWLVPAILLSIPWAISIHTVTAFLYNGLPGRSFWLSAILAPRFLASAFAAGPALLIMVCLSARRWGALRVPDEAIRSIAVVVTYALAVHVFFVLLEVFTVFYSQVPEHLQHFTYLYAGLDGRGPLVPWMWTSAVLAVAALGLLIVPATRRRDTTLLIACACLFVSLWIDKGFGLVVGGFVPSPLGAVARYVPTWREAAIAAGVWALGAGMVTTFFKITAEIRKEPR
jgi:Ni/Fe-hydrogenase subunit HybB-like protein